MALAPLLDQGLCNFKLEKLMFHESMFESDVFVEDFRGFREDLRECAFWSSVQFDGTGLRDLMEKCKKEPMSYSIQSCGGFTGIKHIAFWSDEHKSFMTWRHTPKRLIDGSDPYDRDDEWCDEHERSRRRNRNSSRWYNSTGTGWQSCDADGPKGAVG